MDTAYKTRAWWMLRALTYAHDAQTARPAEPFATLDQGTVWNREADKAAANAMAPAGSECLTRRTVDRRGNLLPEYRA